MISKVAEATTAEIVKILFDRQAYNWTVQEKGALTAAVKLQLEEGVRKKVVRKP